MASDKRIDLLSPAFVAGLIGLGVSGSTLVFLLTAVGAWLIMFAALLFIAIEGSRPVAPSPSQRSSAPLLPAE